VKIGFASLPLSGHLNPMIALARKLQMRGAEVAFLGIPDVASLVRAANLTFVSFGEKEYPVGSMVEALDPLAKLDGLAALEYTCNRITTHLTKTALEHLPKKLEDAGVEALAIDTGHRFLGLVPISLNMPFVQVWPFLHLDSSGTTPPFFFSWPHETTPEARARNIEGLKNGKRFPVRCKIRTRSAVHAASAKLKAMIHYNPIESLVQGSNRWTIIRA
jgi:UDP:flavonoid glycosyltransferase YjiC (YdhE family)